MNLVKLKYFKAVSEHQSISAAAEALYISQPSMSAAIKELEAEFGVELFRRHHRGMVLTTEGAELLKLSVGLLSHANQVERIMNDLGDKRKTLRLGVPPMIGSLFLPKIYSEFVPVHKDVVLDITEAGRQELLTKLTDDLLDMVFLPHILPFDSALNCYKIKKLEIVCCTEKNNPLSNLKEIKPSDLKDVPLVLFKNSFFQTEEIKKWFSAGDTEPKILLQTDQLSTLINMISNNVAVGFLFRELIDKNSNLIPIPVQKNMYADVSLVRKNNARFFSCMDAFFKYIKTQF